MNEAEKLFVRMQNSKAGWGAADLDKLYTGFGFEMREGHGHTIYIHPKHPILRATVARHRRLGIGYVQKAIHLINELKKLEGEANQNG